jgi:pimeloyl-ACP methyl ester carboxylesterase
VHPNGQTPGMISFDEWAGRATMIPVGDVSVALQDRGPRDAPVLTYCHGYPSSTHDVADVFGRLDDWRLVAIDFIGFGASDKPRDRPLTIHRQADAVEAAWAHAGVTSTVLHCHDYGVSVGQELLARRADGTLGVEVTAVVWHNGGLYPDLHRQTVGQQLLRDPEHGAEVAASMTEELFAGGVAVTWGTRVPMTDEVIHEMWIGMSRNGGVPMAHELLHYIDDRREHADRWRAALEHNGLPQTFVWGDLDPVSGAHVMERLVQRLPDATMVPLADVGHWPTLEAPDEVVAAVESHRPG